MKKFHVTNISFKKLKPSEMLVETDASSMFSLKDDNIVMQTAVDLIIPEGHFTDNLIEELSGKIRLFGTVNMRVGNKLYTLNAPVWHNYNVYEFENDTVDLPGLGETKCRIYHYQAGHIFCSQNIVEDYINGQQYLRQIIYGKVPETVPYNKAYALWDRNQKMAGVNFGVSSLIKEVVLSCSYRYRDDPTIRFGTAYSNDPSIGHHAYIMANFRRICQLSSTFAGITFEDFDSMVTSAVNKSRTNGTETYSPLEALLKM